MEAVTADQGKKRRQERAARRAVAAHHQRREFLQLQSEERQAEQAGHGHRDVEPRAVTDADGDAGETAGEAGGEQAGGLDAGTAKIEQLRPIRPARGRADQNGVGGEKRREHHDVAEQENPEPVGNDDPLRRRPALTSSAGMAMPTAAAEPMGVGVIGRVGHRGHVARPASASSAWRSATLARSTRSTSSAGITYSTSSRHANTTKVAKAPIAPAATSHQMCQISAKPMMVAKKAQTKPVGEFLGISM